MDFNKPRMLSTSIQFSDEQFAVMKKIISLRVEIDNASQAQILRESFDLYVQTNYPQFLNLLTAKN